MSLDFDVREMKDKEINFPATEDGKLNTKLHTLTWTMFAIEMTNITEKNLDEVWGRVNLWQKAVGPMFTFYVEGEEPKPILLTKEDIINAKGFRTNVSTITRAQFMKKLWHAANGGRWV